MPIETNAGDRPNVLPIVGYDGPTKTILVADDNGDHRKLIVDLLAPLGFTVLQAKNREQSIGLAMNGAVDLVLLDVCLGSDSGWEVASKIRESHKRIPLVMLSANARGFYNTMPQQRLHDEYLEKPLQIDALLEKIAQLLDIDWSYKATISTRDKNLQSQATAPVHHIHNPRSNSTDDQNIWQDILHLARIGNYNELSLKLSQFHNQGLICDATYRELNNYLNRFDFVSFETHVKAIKR